MEGHPGPNKICKGGLHHPGGLSGRYIGGGVQLIDCHTHPEGKRGIPGDKPRRGTVEDGHGYP